MEEKALSLHKRGNSSFLRGFLLGEGLETLDSGCIRNGKRRFALSWLGIEIKVLRFA